MATTLAVLVDRVRSLLVNSLGFTESQTPFNFDLQPEGVIDGSFRVLSRMQRVIGGFRYSEERIDQLQIWVTRGMNAEPNEATRILTQQMQSITSALVHDGHQVSGEYSVPDDGRAHELRADAGAAYAVLQLTVPVCYEVEL